MGKLLKVHQEDLIIFRVYEAFILIKVTHGEPKSTIIFIGNSSIS